MDWSQTNFEPAFVGDSPYLVGDKMTLADICVGVFLYRLVEIDLNVTLKSNTQQWYERLQLSDAFRKWAMSDFSSLEGRLQH